MSATIENTTPSFAENAVDLMILAAVALAVLLILGLMGTCAVTKVRRDRAFEDACRMMGGVVLTPSTKEGCYKVEPLTVPDYRRR